MSATREIQHQLLRGFGIHPIYSQPIAQHITDLLSDENTTFDDVKTYMRAEFNTYPTDTADYVTKLIMN